MLYVHSQAHTGSRAVSIPKAVLPRTLRALVMENAEAVALDGRGAKGSRGSMGSTRSTGSHLTLPL